MATAKTVPYHTTENEAEYCGHIWRQRERIGGRWGFYWTVTPPYTMEPIAGGWRLTQEEAERAMNEALTRATA